MRKSLRYETSVKLHSLHGEVDGATCECTAGHTGEAHCKHATVLLLAVADLKKKGTYKTELTCTEQLETFHQPKGKFKGTPLKCAGMMKSSKGSSLETIPEDDEKDDYYRAFFRNHLINGQFGSSMPVKSINQPANPCALVNDHSYSSGNPTSPVIKCLQLEEMSTAEVARIMLETMGQASNIKWHLYREGRLTASKIFHFLRGDNKALNAHLSLYPVKFTSKATNHGIKYEPVAVLKYIEDYNITEEVKECGLFIYEKHPFIAGSPDRLLGEDGIVEVKCPYKARKYEVSPANQCYLLKSSDGGLKMNKEHQYYYQVQGQLLVTGRFFCDFVVYTFKSCVRVRVYRDEIFISKLVTDLCDYYQRYMKPAVLNKYFYRDYDKCKFHDMGYCPRT